MYLKSFDSNGNALVSMTEAEITSLSNALHYYCESPYMTRDPQINEIRTQIYIFYEILHHNAAFDSSALSIIQSLRAKEKQHANN